MRAGAFAAVILAPSHLLGIEAEIGAADTVVRAYLGAVQVLKGEWYR
ncbi:hypothetical protein F8B43_4188 [Methylorubrum populi]|uniref:Uncharacterized protein n=1 Tax=Methylorubrum populi TaxID=223967 RepID=A0A833N231_9HYPH|nr:hypothetical protein F8B43_4188 [Methylorubrum populi]